MLDSSSKRFVDPDMVTAYTHVDCPECVQESQCESPGCYQSPLNPSVPESTAWEEEWLRCGNCTLPCLGDERETGCWISVEGRGNLLEAREARRSRKTSG